MKRFNQLLKKCTNYMQNESKNGSGSSRFASLSILSRQSVLMILCMLLLGIGEVWGWDFNSSWTVYFDMQNCTDFGTPYLRVGKDNDGGASNAYQMSLALGTKYLYEKSGVSWSNYGAFSIANGKGWENSGQSIFQPKDGQQGNVGYTGDMVITKQTNFQKYEISTNSYLKITNSSGSSSYGCSYYQVNNYTTNNGNGELVTLPTYSATINTPSNGTLTVYKYTSTTYDTDKNTSTNFTAISDGATGLLPTHILKIVTTPSSGYRLLNLTVTNGTKIEDVTGGVTYYIYDNVEITATFERIHDVTVSYEWNGNTIKASTTIEDVGESTAEEVDAPEIAGYSFVNWTLGAGVADQGSDLTANPISVKTLSTGSYTMQANYVENLTSTWHIIGTPSSVFPNEWTSNDDNMLRKASGSSTDPVGSLTINVTAVGASESSYQFKAYNLATSSAYGYGTGDTHYWLNRGNPSPTLSTEGVNTVYFIPDGLGEYPFSLNWGGTYPVLTVTFPTISTVTYGMSATGGSSVTAKYSDVSFSSGTKVQEGKTVVFTATPSDGYHLVNWYSNSTGSDGTQLSSDETYVHTVTSTNNVYAIFAESMSSIDISAGVGGSVSGSGTMSLGKITKQAISATPGGGYYFVRWDVTGDARVDDASSASTNATTNGAVGGNGTITAVFAPRFGLVGSRDVADNPAEGMPEPVWEEAYAADFVVNSYASDASLDFTCVRNLYPNRVYKFQVIDHKNNDTQHGYQSKGTMAPSTPATLDGKSDVLLTTKGYGAYTFKISSIDGNNNPSLQYIEQSSKLLTLAWEDVDVDGNANTTSRTTYGEVTARTSNGGGFDIETGEYVADEDNITFTAVPEDGYSLEGWYNNSDYAEEHKYVDNSDDIRIDESVENTLTLKNISEAVNVYAKIVENSTAVKIAANNPAGGSITVGGDAFTWESTTNVGITTGKELIVTAATGYYFAGWEKTACTDYQLGTDESSDYAESATTRTLKGKGTGSGGQVLTALFMPLDKVYFRNWNEQGSEPLWDNVYVYFGITWTDDNRPHSSNIASNIVQMAQIGTSNVYWAYVPRAEYTNTKIAFSEHNFGTNYTFDGYTNVKWGSYNRALNMCVPKHYDSETIRGVTFYKSYWKNYGLSYGDNAGYVIKRWDGDSYENPANNGTGKYNFIVVDDNTIEYSLRVDNTTSGWNKYMIKSAGGIQYITLGTDYNGKTVESGECDNIQMTQYDTNNPRFDITPTLDGIYTLTIDQSTDKMMISVNYPIAEGDYRVMLTDASGNKISRSDIIKSAKASSWNTVSMYINTTSTNELIVEKADLSTNPITWTRSSSVWTTHSSKFNKGNGVYKFNVKISDDAISDIDQVGLYDGDFYIKTDTAPGGWTAYKLNLMEKNTINFSKSDASTFDYAFCHWVDEASKKWNGSAWVDNGSSSTNIKCVIANDYNNAISDTLESDAILGGSSQTLPYSAHVRFSYNSYTNELKRTYLYGREETDFLVIEGNTISSGATKMVHTSLGAEFTKAQMSNQSNFTYMLDVKARETARVRLTATYDGKVQYLLGASGSVDGADNANTVQIMGGSSAVETYKPIRLTYDFKTNQLMAAWLVDGVQIDADKALQSDLMIIREGQGDAHQITFGSGKKMTNVDKVYGVMHFQKDDLNDEDLSRYERDLYWISFPFDVKLSDAFGMGTYGTHWIIEYYDGKGRAEHGFWADSEPNWKFVTPYMREHGGADGQGYILNANEGYILALDLDELGEGSLVWDNGIEDAYLYFPSIKAIKSIQSKDTTVTIDQEGYYCSINRGTTDGDRRVKDSYWHCIGIPSFATASNVSIQNGENWTGDPAIPNVTGENIETAWSAKTLPFLYEWNSSTNTVTAKNAAKFDFKPMYSYLVQYSQTTLEWKAVSRPWVASVMARQQDEAAERNIVFSLALQQDEETLDETFVRMTNDEAATNGFEFGQDLSKEFNRNKANIYTFIGTEQVAGNSMPFPTTITTVPVGVKVVANGEYTLAMPEGTNGEDVYLIDNAYGTRTNLGLMPYTVTLTAGTYEGRFVLELCPIQDSPTSLENDGLSRSDELNDAIDGVRKVFVGGRLYIIRDGKVYDAAGQRIE